jgi:hypothetical protein
LHGSLAKRMKLFNRLAPRPFRRRRKKKEPAPFYVPGDDEETLPEFHEMSDK